MLLKKTLSFWVTEDAFKNPSSYESMEPKVMLYQTGYLTLAKAIDSDVYLKFPNLEIISSFAKLQYLYLFKNANALTNSRFNQELSKLNFDTPLDKIIEYFSSILNLLDYQKNTFNHECHVITPIFCYLYAKKFNVMQEKHSLLGRADLVIDFDNKNTLVFEFKFRKTRSKKTAEDLLNEALLQIKEKQYTQILDKNLKGYALVFDQESKKFVAFKQS